MLLHNKALRRVELNHPRFADRSDVRRLKTVLSLERARLGASRAVLRVLTDRPEEDSGFRVEASISTRHGDLTYFGRNERDRLPDDGLLHAETRYLARTLVSPRRPVPQDHGIAPLEKDGRTAASLAELYASIYSDYPEPLDASSILGRMEGSIAYGASREGRLVAALFGCPADYGPLKTVEFTLSATLPTARGTGLTTALAAAIRAEAMRRFGDPLMLAETIAAPVMRSCRDMGMEVCGVMPEHTRIGIGANKYRNLYVWYL
jgi:hypothetical protein